MSVARALLLGLWLVGAAQAQFGPGGGRRGPGGPGGPGGFQPLPPGGAFQPPPPGPWNGDLKLTVLHHDQPAIGPLLFLTHAGVPSLALRLDGALVAAFQWFPPGEPQSFDRIAAMASRDHGTSWTLPQTIAIDGWPENLQRPFDPTLVSLPDGRLRLYFTTGDGPPGPNQATWIGSATSDDGFRYTFEPGIRWRNPDGARTFDPAVTLLGGQFVMACPKAEGGAYLAHSADGLTFEPSGSVADWAQHPWIGNLVAGAALRFYGGGPDGVWYREQTADGWGTPVLLRIEGGDPAVVDLGDGVSLLLAVRMRPPEGMMQPGPGGPVQVNPFGPPPGEPGPFGPPRGPGRGLGGPPFAR